MIIKLRCRICNKLHFFIITQNEYKRLLNGELIQNVLPHFSASQREMLISGICNMCWDIMFLNAD